MSYDTTGAPNDGVAQYRAYCPKCRKSGREFTQYGNAENAAGGHARQHRHVTWVIDHYGIKVTGSTQEPQAAASNVDLDGDRIKSGEEITDHPVWATGH